MPRVAVIDDDPNLRDLLSIHLAGVGLAVETYEDAAAGIRGLLASAPDLLVLDLNLPDLGGMEVLAAIKNDDATRNLPVVVLTSVTSRGAQEAARRLGAEAFLNKPIARDDLIRTVLDRLARSAAARG